MRYIFPDLTQLSQEAIAGLQRLIEISQKYHENHSSDKFVDIEGEPQEQTVKRLEKFLIKSISLYSEYSTLFSDNEKHFYPLSKINETLYDEIEQERNAILTDCLAIDERLENMKKELNNDEDGIVKDGLNIKTVPGKIIKCDYNPKITVSQLKMMIHEREGIPPDQQRLIFGGKQLDNKLKLYHYNIKQNDTVHLVLGLRGAKPVILLYDNEQKENEEVNVKLTLSDAMNIGATYPSPSTVNESDIIKNMSRKESIHQMEMTIVVM